MKILLSALMMVGLLTLETSGHKSKGTHPDDAIIAPTANYSTRTLVVIESWSLLSSHSLFFDNMREDGHVLTFKMASSNPEIKYYDQYFYDNILLMAPSTILKENLAQAELIDFVDKEGHNILMFADESSGITYRKLANQFGIDFEMVGYELRDHDNNNSKKFSQEGEVVFSSHLFEGIKDTPIFTKPEAEIAFRGVGHLVDSTNDFVFPILRAADSTFSTKSDYSDISSVSGNKLSLVSAYQARNNNRVLFVGSMDMCSNKFSEFSKVKGLISTAANNVFCHEIAQWAYQQRGVLVQTHHKHFEVDTKHTGVDPENYPLETEIVFYTRISAYHHEHRGTVKEWGAFNRKDVQMEFFMLDPYYRLDMKLVCGFSGTYKQFLRTPHKLGIYKLKVHYWRYGYTYLDYEKEVSNIQLRHDQHPRFIQDAAPNYLAVACCMAAFAIFVMVFGFSEHHHEAGKKVKKD
jgi:oligosaccharyltransferase complex subunit beta